MLVKVTQVPPASSGGIAGTLSGVVLNPSSYAMALFTFDGTRWSGQTSAIPVSSLWSYAASGTGQAFAVALVSFDYKLTNALPPLGDDVLGMTVLPANRLAFTGLPTGGGPGTVSGTVGTLTGPESYYVQAYRWENGAGWASAGTVAPATDGTWSVSSVASSLQYAAVLTRTAGTPPPGLLPSGTGVLSTLYSAAVAIVATTVPPPTGGPIAGELLGLNGAPPRTQVLVFALAPVQTPNNGTVDRVESWARAELQATGTWRLARTAFGAKWGLVLADESYAYVDGAPFPRVGGPVIATSVINASVASPAVPPAEGA